MPGEPVTSQDDWQADLREFVEVTRDSLAPHLEPSGMETAENLRRLFNDALTREGDDANRPGFGAEELAQVFIVARHLKRLSLQLAACEALPLRPECWWTEGRSEDARRFAVQLGQATDGYLLGCGHFDVPRARSVVEWLVNTLAEPAAVI